MLYTCINMLCVLVKFSHKLTINVMLVNGFKISSTDSDPE